MKAGDMRALSPSDLQKQLDGAYQELFNLRFRLETRQLENTSEIGKTRRKIARFKTVLRERQLLEAGQG
jgi:large subunit ribosomal protein L29